MCERSELVFGDLGIFSSPQVVFVKAVFITYEIEFVLILEVLENSFLHTG